MLKGVREFGEPRPSRTPDFKSVHIGIYNLLKVSRQRLAISGVATTIRSDTFSNVKYDAGETILVKIDFLVIWNLSDGARGVNRLERNEADKHSGGAHLTSANEAGRSAIRAPPKRGVLRYVAILSLAARLLFLFYCAWV